MESKVHFVYMFLDPRKPGEWEYKGIKFDHRPFYVGKGKDDRITRHFRPASLSKNNIKNAMINKMIKDGYSPITMKMFENLTDQNSKEIEIDVISHFGRIDLGTGILANMTDGGDGPGRVQSASKIAKLSGPSILSHYIHQFSLDWEFIRTWETFTAIKRAMNFDPSSISKAADDPENKTSYGFRWQRGESSYVPPPPKRSRYLVPCFQYSLDGDFIQRFDSLIDATRAIGTLVVRIDNRTIKRGGFQWTFEDKGEKIPKALTGKAPMIPVIEYSPKLDLIKFYPSLNKTGIESGTIIRLIRDQSLSKRGTLFQYAPKDQDLTDLAALNIPEINEIVRPLLAALN